jgi:glutamyl-tRNA reductase
MLLALEALHWLAASAGAAFGKELSPGGSTELERAQAIVAKEVNRFTAGLQSREILATLVALSQRFEAIRRAELTRLAPKLSALSAEARTRLDEITRLMVEKLLLTPTEQLKSVGDGTMGLRYADALNRLFRLTVEGKVESPSEGSETAVLQQ